MSPFSQRYISGEMGEVLHTPNTCLQQTHQNINNFIASIDKVYHFSPTTSLSLGFTHQYNRSTTEITTVDQRKCGS